MAFESLAYPLIAPWAGVAAGRLNRRAIMLVCDASRAVLFGFFVPRRLEVERQIAAMQAPVSL